MVQELLFYRVRPIPALRYFKNTVLMTGKSQLSMTMRMWPSLFKRKEEAGRFAAKADFRSQPRLLLMFTWEEAGQLRSMMLLVIWGVVVLLVAPGTFVEQADHRRLSGFAPGRVSVELQLYATGPVHQPRG